MRYDPREVGGAPSATPSGHRFRWQDKDGGGPFADTIPSIPTTTVVIATPGSQSSLIDYVSDQDWFRVRLNAGVTYNFAVTGDTLSNPYLSLYDPSGMSVLAFDDDSGAGLNALISSYTASTGGVYFLNVGGVGASTGAYTLETFITDPGDDIAGDNSTLHALTINGTPATSAVDTSGDQDWYRITLNAGESYAFSMDQTVAGSAGLDAFLRLYNSDGILIAVDDDGGPSSNSLMRFTAVTTGTYYIAAGGFETDTGGYTISAANGPAQNPLDTLDLEFTFAATNINVYFATAGQDIGPLSAAVRSWTSAEIASVMSALQTIANVTNLTFTQVGSSAGAHFIMALTDLPENVLGVTYPNPTQAHLAFDPYAQGWNVNGLQPGGLGYSVIIHEAGHALGLDHPHMDGLDVQVMQGVIDSFDSFGTFDMNQGVFTIMSYNDGWPRGHGAPPNYNIGYSSTPMALDVAMLQSLYGANAGHNVGDTIYTLPAADAIGNGSYLSIWDKGGIDTIVHGGGGFTTIDLNDATLLSEFGGGGFVSSVSGTHAGFTIAHGVVIENATGGSGGDTIIGNEVANVLIGNGGSDIISGFGGNDRIAGGSGQNKLDGGAGIDTSVYAVASTIVEVSINSDGSFRVYYNGGASNDNLRSMELLQFTDRYWALDNAEQTFSGNLTSDIMFRNANDGQVAAWEVAGANFVSAAIAGAIGSEWVIQGSGDFSGDGRDDILIRNSDTGMVVSWRNANWMQADFLGAAPDDWVIEGIGDFNFDGRDDFLWRNVNHGTVVTWLLDGAGSASHHVISGAPSDWSVAAVADFNGDGSDEILWRNDSGTLAHWTTNGVSQTAASIVGFVPGEWRLDGVGDFDFDGRQDLLWRNTSDGGAAIWRMDGANQLEAQMIGAAPLAWQVADVGDYTGDGKDDILWRHDDGTIVMWRMNGFHVVLQNVLAWVPPEWDIV